MEKIIYLLILFIYISNTKQFDLESCRYPIGIETGKILDAAFSASSYANENTHPSKARIRSETDGWCPLNKISSTTYEYLEINLINLTVITLIELQGKYSLKPNEQFADAFRIEYRREKNQTWIKYKDFSGQYILSGNSNSYIPTIRDIFPSIIAKQIRIIPIVTGSISKYICIRLELYGCFYQDGLISYSIPQGDKRGYNNQFFDKIYDGKYENGILKDGLGQLTDGILGEDNYDLTNTNWIGWKNRSNINLIFYFDTFRNLTSIRIHTSNYIPYDIYLFHLIKIQTCENSHFYEEDFLISNDYFNITSRFIQIFFKKKFYLLTNCLNITLYFNTKNKWILISEIEFNSIPINLFHLKHSNKDNSWYWLSAFIFIFFIILLLFFYIQHNTKKFLPNNLRYQLIVSTNNSIHSSNISPMSTIHSYLTTLSHPYSSIDIPNNIQGPCGNNTYECLKESLSMIIPQVNDKQIIIGQVYSTMNECFGTIFRGYLYLHQPYDILKPILIKILTTKDTNQKKLFDKEHELINHLHHPNLVQFYGYTIKQNYALIEHSDLGDVYTHLSTSKNISKNLRLHMIIQLSNALRYLESCHIIHRDISARNCLIYPNYEIKLTNSAMASEQFQLHYYQINHFRLPIRWMAPESILNNEFTIQSDIWSFGITIWEIMTHCLILPYHFLNDKQVYQRLKLKQGLHLSKPECFSKELIDLMLECWRPYDERPTFYDIYMFFNKRLDGMNVI